MNAIAKRVIAGGLPLAALPIALLRRMTAGRQNVLHVLTYHRIDLPNARADLSPATLSATPTDFAKQMHCLKTDFFPVGIEQVCDAVVHGRTLPPRAVLITFDDAYRDFLDNAWPVLRQLQLPTVVFVPTRYADDPDRAFWWDRLHAAVSHAPDGACLETSLGSVQLGSVPQRRALVRRLVDKLSSKPHCEALDEIDRITAALSLRPAPPAVMNWNELRCLAAEGVALAPHTRTHPLMNRIPLEEARREAVGSRDDLLRNIGSCPPVFAYPGGQYDDRTKAMLADAGFHVAFSTRRGANRLSRCDSLELRRINIGLRTTVDVMRTQLSLPPLIFNACAS